jgi:hypothetical protein
VSLEPFTSTAPPQAVRLAAPVQADAATPMPGAPSTDTESTAPSTNDNPFAFSAMDIVAPAATVSQNRGSTSSADRIRTTANSSGGRWIYALGAFLVLAITLTIAIILGRSLTGSKAPAKKTPVAADASVQVMPPLPLLFELGGTKTIVVKIQRQGFSGPVRIELHDLPEYISAKAITISEGQSQGEMKLTVSYPPRSIKAELRLVAVAENLRDECFMSVEVKGPDQAKKKGKS